MGITSISNKEEILNNASKALLEAVLQCKNRTGDSPSPGNTSSSENARNWAETAYYLSQVIKDLEK